MVQGKEVADMVEGMQATATTDRHSHTATVGDPAEMRERLCQTRNTLAQLTGCLKVQVGKTG